ncbi:MAG: hypothetical protein O6913_00870 [Chloroflexi bacterium]|nr:hypothetical protein [Chloroflexota bacterium]
MHAHALRWIVLTLVTASALVSGLVGGASAQASDHGIALPAPAETVWSITAGYNTGTHFGSDPYAIDLVRVDGPTTGTAVLAPVTGVVSWRSPSCLTILDGLGQETLVCHLFVADAVTVGDTVRPGDLLGTVAAPGFAENNGLAHIHLAVHRTIGDGQILETLPFAGAYALEGVDLTATTAANAYRGQLFTSSNGAPNTATEVPLPPPAVEEDPPAIASTTVTLEQGWNLIGLRQTWLLDELAPSLPPGISGLFGFDAPTQSFLTWAPGLPPSLNTLAVVSNTAALFVLFDGPPATILDLPPPVAEPIPLTAGFNLVTWTGPLLTVNQAITGLDGALVGLHAFDAPQQAYRSYRTALPGPLNDLTQLAPGQSLWVEVSSDVIWDPSDLSAPPIVEQPPPEPDPDPQPDPLPQPDPEVDDQQEGWVLGPGCLNLRAVPTTLNNAPLTCLPSGTALLLTGDTAIDELGDLWYRVAVQGLTGWLFAGFVQLADDPFLPDGVIGEATFYHRSLAGNAMYCGGIYNPNDPTVAASTAWPCGTRLRVSHGGNSIDVVVQDTGFLGGFHLDLSEAGFQALAPLAEGRISIHIEVLS